MSWLHVDHSAYSPAKKRHSSVARSAPCEQTPKAAEAKAKMLNEAMRQLFRASYPTQELPNEETLKKHWEGSNQSDRESYLIKVTEAFNDKKKVTVVDVEEEPDEVFSDGPEGLEKTK